MTGRPILYRAATPDDHPAIAAMWLASWMSTPVALELTQSAPNAESLRERLDEEAGGKWDITLAEDGGTNAGGAGDGGAVLGFLAIDRAAAILDQLFIAPAAQGMGIGTALLHHAMAAMPAGFTLRTAASNSATGFYDRAGLDRIRMMVHPAMGHRLVQFRWAGLTA